MPESEAVLIAESTPPTDAHVEGGRRERRCRAPERSRDGGKPSLASMAVLAVALLALIPTTGDFGLTWDEPAYRFSQVMSAQWWEQLGRARSWVDIRQLLDPETLLYHWPYGRYGINFHPPLAGQLNLATHALLCHWMKDIPARRMASVIEFALAITIGFHFLARRYGVWTGVGMAGSLLLMPRLYGQAHLIDTDTPGLLLWAATAVAFWKGLYEPAARRWRIAVGVLLGLAFIEKMSAVSVMLPLLLWLTASRLPRALLRKGAGADWIDGLLTTGAMIVPLGLAFLQIQVLQRQLPLPKTTNLFIHRPVSDLPGAILALPLVIWLVRRLLGWIFPRSRVWGVERPGLETGTAILAFAPVVGWLGNPAWWRETLPRLAHYYTLSNPAGRQESLQDIQIIYLGQIYEFSLPWHNAFVLLGITVPVATVIAAAIGVVWGIGEIRRDRLPLYFLVHFLCLPVIRMFPTPAHDGVRLFLPTFFFLAAFAGWGLVWLADLSARAVPRAPRLARRAVFALALGSAAVALIRIHPYELSYYNELVGGPRGAWERGFELSYWYDAFNPPVIEELNRRFPPHAQVDFLSDLTQTASGVFQELQSLGSLRSDIVLAGIDRATFPHVWLLTHDSKATAFTRLLFAMRPWFASEPRQLQGARVLTVDDPLAVSRAWALRILLDAPDRAPPDPPSAPPWVQTYAPWLGRLWGDGLDKSHRLTLNQSTLDWSRRDPEGLEAAARKIAARQPLEKDSQAKQLWDLMTSEPNQNGPRHWYVDQLLSRRPEAFVEAVQILNAHREEVITVMTWYGYTDVSRIGGYLDRDLPGPGTRNRD
jgi:hypothetical protein